MPMKISQFQHITKYKTHNLKIQFPLSIKTERALSHKSFLSTATTLVKVFITLILRKIIDTRLWD